MQDTSNKHLEWMRYYAQLLLAYRMWKKQLSQCIIWLVLNYISQRRDAGGYSLYHTILYKFRTFMNRVEHSPSSFVPCHKATCCSIQCQYLLKPDLGCQELLLNPFSIQLDPKNLVSHKSVFLIHLMLLPSPFATTDLHLERMVILICYQLKGFPCLPTASQNIHPSSLAIRSGG